MGNGVDTIFDSTENDTKNRGGEVGTFNIV